MDKRSSSQQHTFQEGLRTGRGGGQASHQKRRKRRSSSMAAAKQMKLPRSYRAWGPWCIPQETRRPLTGVYLQVKLHSASLSCHPHFVAEMWDQDLRDSLRAHAKGTLQAVLMIHTSQAKGSMQAEHIAKQREKIKPVDRAVTPLLTVCSSFFCACHAFFNPSTNVSLTV